MENRRSVTATMKGSSSRIRTTRIDDKRTPPIPFIPARSFYRPVRGHNGTLKAWWRALTHCPYPLLLTKGELPSAIFSCVSVTGWLVYFFYIWWLDECLISLIFVSFGHIKFIVEHLHPIYIIEMNLLPLIDDRWTEWIFH